MRAFAAAVLFLAACDFYSGHPDRGDAGPSGGNDGGADSCATWTLKPTTASALEPMDQPPYETGRTTRVAVTTELTECAERAMPTVALDTGSLTATITISVWRQTGGDCVPAEGTIVRPILMQIPDPGEWTIVVEGAEPLKVTIEDGPAGQCGAGGGDCRRDCDCDAGEVCLRGTGIGGPFSACVRTCELDRDCGGDGLCADVADGLNRTCATGDECERDGTRDCPEGYACDVDSASCSPSFTLSQEARGPCACDSDCTSGLHCVRAQPDYDGHCEVACPTAGPWCEGAHVCGAAADDASGIATTDSVCVWLGE